MQTTASGCARTTPTLIDRDDSKYTVDVLRDWKYEAEDRAMKTLGQPRGYAKGSLASVSPASRLGAEQSVLVDGQPIPYVSTFDADDDEEQMTWYVSAFVNSVLDSKTSKPQECGAGSSRCRCSRDEINSRIPTFGWVSTHQRSICSTSRSTATLVRSPANSGLHVTIRNKLTLTQRNSITLSP